jgi:hypothetical protein
VRNDDDTQLADVLAGSFQTRLIVDVFYDDEPLFRDLPVTDYSLAWDLESELKSSGSLAVHYSGTAADSLTPREFTDVLAPFGQQVNVLMEVRLGDVYTGTLQLGRYRIAQTPEASDSFMRLRGQTLVQGSTVKITIDDLLSTVKRWGFRWPAPPIHADSTWDELQRISGLPIDANLDDRPTPAGLIYEPSGGGRLKAVQQLASYLGGTGYTTPYGELSAIPFTAGPVVNRLTMGREGRILDWPTSMDSDDIFNAVVGTYQADDGTPIYSIAQQATGALAVGGPFGENTYYDQSDTVATQAQADARTAKLLGQLLSNQTYRVTVVCLLDPRIEFGDVIELVSPFATVTGRVVAYSFGTDGTMQVTLDVRR